MRSIFLGLNQIEQFRVLDKNRERENLVLKFFGFSLSSLSSLSHLSKPSLLHSPSPDPSSSGRPCVRRGILGQARTPATFTSFRTNLEHRRAASKSHANYRGLHVRRCSGHAAVSSDFLLLQSISWSSKEGQSTSEGLQKLLHEDHDPKPSPSTSCATITPRWSCQPLG